MVENGTRIISEYRMALVRKRPPGEDRFRRKRSTTPGVLVFILVVNLKRKRSDAPILNVLFDFKTTDYARKYAV